MAGMSSCMVAASTISPANKTALTDVNASSSYIRANFCHHIVDAMLQNDATHISTNQGHNYILRCTTTTSLLTAILQVDLL